MILREEQGSKSKAMLSRSSSAYQPLEKAADEIEEGRARKKASAPSGAGGTNGNQVRRETSGSD